ncbi:MAG TPA: flagellar biosynthetic protein FliQ [Myxococcaceae bacterium]|nr:flagellar biosynthetic protein FliQ [Myxococcaceae bacterium]
MDPAAVGALWREAAMSLATVGAPLLGALLLSGLVVGILQAATQVNDPAVSFLPRFGVTVAMVWMLGAWMAERMAGFLAHSIQRMSGRF